MSEKYILTVDLGTSGPKVSLFDMEGAKIGSAFEEIPLLLFDGGGAEQKPSDWIEALKKAYKTLIDDSGIDTRKIVALNCTAQWSGTVPIGKNGKELMNCVLWMDSRGAPYIQKMMSGFPEVEGYNALKLYRWLNITGGAPTKSGKDSVAHILYIKNELPEIYANTDVFLEPKDYLNYYFTGIKSSSFDSATVLWLTDNRKINDIKYVDSLIKITGIDKAKLPALIPTNSILGNVSSSIAEEFGLNPETKVISGTPDIQSAAVGSGAVIDFEPHVYIGTSAWLVCHLPFKKTDIFHNMGAIPSALPGRYLLVNEQETAGACLNFMKNNLFYHKDELNSEDAPADFYQMADKIVSKTAPGSEGLMFTPWLYGERSPVDDHHIRAGFHNLSLNHNRTHMIRSVYEGIALNVRWLLGYAEKLAGKQFESIRFIGGGANSDVWSQIFADVLNRPVKQVSEPLLANSRGAALLALLALGLKKTEDISKAVIIKNTYQPNPANRKLYDERFTLFTEIYKKNKAIHHQLNK